MCVGWGAKNQVTSLTNEKFTQIAFLSVLFQTALGMILLSIGNVIQEFGALVPAWLRLQFTGALIAALFWVSQPKKCSYLINSIIQMLVGVCD